MDLSDRQQQLLKAIIDDFITSGEPVGSLALQTKYQFKVSPATIRNEMSDLVLKGYLFMKHSSGGRIPTTKGWRFYLDEIDDETEDIIDVVTREKVKIELNKVKFETENLIRNSLNYLNSLTGNVAVALIDKDVYYAGLSNMVMLPEFRELEKLRNILRILEDYSTLAKMFEKGGDAEIRVLVGEEADIDLFDDYAVVFSEIKLPDNKNGYLAVVGPNRMNYQMVIASVKYFSNTIGYLIRGWK